jgi:hypothetical protein
VSLSILQAIGGDIAAVGVIGQRRNGSTLYVALDETIESAVVVLGPLAPSRTASRGLALVESRWLVRHLMKDQYALRFEAQGYGDGSFTWSGASSGAFRIAVDRDNKDLWRQTVETDDAGTLKFVLPVSAIEPVTVRIDCAPAAHSAEQ